MFKLDKGRLLRKLAPLQLSAPPILKRLIDYLQMPLAWAKEGKEIKTYKTRGLPLIAPIATIIINCHLADVEMEFETHYPDLYVARYGTDMVVGIFPDGWKGEEQVKERRERTNSLGN